MTVSHKTALVYQQHLMITSQRIASLASFNAIIVREINIIAQAVRLTGLDLMQIKFVIVKMEEILVIQLGAALAMLE